MQIRKAVYILYKSWNLKKKGINKRGNSSLGELTGGYCWVFFLNFDCKFLLSSDRCAWDTAVFKK
jgi:hypothetical protein